MKIFDHQKQIWKSDRRHWPFWTPSWITEFSRQYSSSTHRFLKTQWQWKSLTTCRMFCSRLGQFCLLTVRVLYQLGPIYNNATSVPNCEATCLLTKVEDVAKPSSESLLRTLSNSDIFSRRHKISCILCIYLPEIWTVQADTSPHHIIVNLQTWLCNKSLVCSLFKITSEANKTR